MTTAELLGRLASYVYTIYLSYVIGVEGIGIIATALSIVDIFVVMVSNGLDSYAINEIAKSPKKVEKTVSAILLIKSGVGILFYALLFVIIMLLDKPSIETYAVLIAGIHIFGRGINGKWIYQGLQRMNIIALRQTVSSVLLVLGVIIFVTTPDEVLIALAVQVIVELINTVWVLFYYRRDGYNFNFDLPITQLKSIALKALPFGVFFLLVGLYNTIDKNMIWLLRDDFQYQNGILHSSIKIMALFLAPTIIIQNVFYPKFSGNKNINSKASTHSDYTRLLSMFLSFGLGIMYFYPEIATLIFPDMFSEVEALLPYHAWISTIIYLVMCFTIPLMAWGNQKSLIWITGAAVMLNLIVNYILIPSYSVYGALTATIGSELLVLLASIGLMLKSGVATHLKYPLFAVSISFLTFGGLSYLGLSSINLIFAIAISSVANLILLYLFKVVDFELLKKLAKS